jgi:hypothetical protein
MNNDLLEDLRFAGTFTVDSGQAIVGDPCYLPDYDPNENQEWNLEGKIGEYSYQGISATTLKENYGEIGGARAVAFSTGYGDGQYPVYVKLDSDNRVSMVVIDFLGNLDEEQD